MQPTNREFFLLNEISFVPFLETITTTEPLVVAVVAIYIPSTTHQ